jgi:histone acetyltransferase MYST1
MDLFAGTVNRENAGGILWVCDRCFKYMADGTSWEVHMVWSIPPSPSVWRRGVLTYSSRVSADVQRRCTRKHPPGRKVYQRGAHTIWEVDGAKEKVRMQKHHEPVIFSPLMRGEQLYCQNLSLFGKLFIDIKTLFFDCDNCEPRYPVRGDMLLIYLDSPILHLYRR